MKTQKIFFITAFILLTTVCISLGRITYASAISTELSNQLNSIHTMRATFVQTTYDNKNRAVQQASGTMALERPGKFYWEVKKPIPQIVIANQSRLWIYDPDLEQVTIRALHQAAGETPALLLSHVSNTLDEDFVIRKLQKTNPQWQWYHLTPKSSDNMFASVEMGFLQNQIKEMRLQDHLGHTIRIQFQQIHINLNLPARLFIFKTSKKIDIIDETKQR